MRGVNKVIIVGNLGADPEVRQFSNGGSVTSISVATSEQWTDKQTGERRENTEWHRISLFNRLGEVAAQYLRKGSSVYIEGSLRTRKYQDQSGQDRYITEIRADNMQMLGGTGSGGGQGGGYNQGNQNYGGQSGQGGGAQAGFGAQGGYNQGNQNNQNSFGQRPNQPQNQNNQGNNQGNNPPPMSDAPVDDDIPF